MIVPRQPVILPSLERDAQAAVEHPWFADKDQPIIVTVCRLAAVKDVPNLVRAFAILRAARLARLVIAGDGPEASRVRGAAALAGVERDVLLVGFDLNPWRGIARADVLAVSSVSEGMSCTTLIDALTRGVPVVSTDCGGPRDVLESERWGELVPPGDPGLVANALMRALDGGRPTEAREIMRQRYSVSFALPAYRHALLGG